MSLAILAISVCCIAVAEELTTTVSKVVGKVEVIKAGTTELIPATDGMTLSIGDTLKTGDNSSVTLTFLAGNMLQVVSNAQLKIEKNQLEGETPALNARVAITSGQLKAILKNLPPKSVFEVETPTAVAAVRGTVYYVGSNGEIYVEEGSVTVTNILTGEQFVVYEGQIAVVSESGAVDGPREPAAGEVDTLTSEFVPLAAEPYTPPERPDIVITPNTPAIIEPIETPASEF